MRRDDQRAPIVTRWIVVGDRRSAHQIRFLPPEVVVSLIGLLRGALNVVLVHRAAVSDQNRVPHLHRVAGRSHYPLHIVQARINGIGEDDHISIPRSVKRGKLPAAARNSRAVYELVDEEKIALEQRVLHAPARDLERLDAKGADDHEERERDDDDLCPVHKEAELAVCAPFVGELKRVRAFVFVLVHYQSIPR